MDFGKRPAAVALGVLDLGADLGGRPAVPGHLDRGKAPLRMARHMGAVVVLGLMTGVAVQAGGAEIGIAAHHHGQVQVAVVALTRAIARRVTVDAARVQNDLLGLGEQRARALRRVGDIVKGACRFQVLGLLLSPTGRRLRQRRDQRQQDAGRSEDHPPLHGHGSRSRALAR
jgi:hypothetical protein